MAALVAQVQRGVIGVLRQSSVATLYSLALRLKEVGVLDGHSSSSSSRTTELEAVADVVSERDMSADILDGLIPSSSSQVGIADRRNQAQRRTLKKGEHGLHQQLIPAASWRVLNRLQDEGYESYLVGGSVRDLLLKQTPKDFDVLTTADPKQVKKSFPGHCIIVGKRFPICHVSSLNTVIEVSSFCTSLDNQKGETVAHKGVKGTEGWDMRDFARWENCLKRDFTVNGLMYDPFQSIVYDYVGGLRDLRKFQVRTVIPADESFQEDPARILRAIRIAARLEFSFTKSTARAIRDHKLSLLELNKTRLQLEMNMLMAYGASARSIRLLWRYGILEYLLPLQAQYLIGLNFQRRDQRTNLFLELLANMDSVTGADRPCHGGLWVAVLAFHLALIERPRRPVVVAAVAFAMYYATGFRKALVKAWKLHEASERTSIWGELASETTETPEEETLDDCRELVIASIDKVNQLSIASITGETRHILTGANPDVDMVVVSKPLFYRAHRLFDRAVVHESDEESSEDMHKQSGRKARNSDRVSALTSGDLGELGLVFSHIVLSTLYTRAEQTDLILS
ncbi:hypothetical protein CY35_08G032600 [Sphagnum magellanicum]|nr:hypothetical protein CY35_08G032600 [Sphagnum magellanicum]